MSRSSYVEPTALGLVLAALQPTNRLVFEATGLRVGDVLKLTTEQVKRQRFTVRESKTGKTRRVYLPAKLQLQLLAQAGRLYVFEGRIRLAARQTSPRARRPDRPRKGARPLGVGPLTQQARTKCKGGPAQKE